MGAVRRIQSWCSTSFLSSPKKRAASALQLFGLVVLGGVVALSSSFAPVQAASRTALKWTPQTTATNTQWKAITWSPELNLFVAVTGGASGVQTSPDGKTWTPRAASSGMNWASVTWSSELGIFVAVAGAGTGGRTMISPDGINWTQSSSIAAYTWASVAWSPQLNLFTAVACGVSASGLCDSGRLATSPDGVTWTPRTVPTTNQLWDVEWSPSLGLFVTVAVNGTNQVLTSPDGITWTPHATPAGAWHSLVWSPELNLFVAAGIDGKIMTSPDGINWTPRTSAQANGWRDITWSPQLGLFAAVARTGTNRVMTSPDGINWTTGAATQNNSWWGITWSPGLNTFAAVSTDGTSRVMTGSMITATTSAPSSIGETTATLSGTYTDSYPGATVFFRYRATGSGGAFTATAPQTANTSGTYTANISGLDPNTNYEYTVVVQWPSANGTQEIQGGLENFTTAESKVHYHKTVSPVVTTITPGQTFTYTVTVENQGTTNLTGLSFTDDLSDVVDDATYNNDVNASAGTPSWNGTDQISWNGSVNAGQTATITYSFTMNNPTTGDGQLINGVVGTGPQSNCTASPAIDPECRTTSPLPVLASQKTLVSPANPKAGDTVNYQFVITNTGAAGASNVAVADDLSQVLDDAAYNNDANASTGTVTYDSSSKRLIWNGNLAANGSAGDSVTVTYSVKVNGSDNLGDALLNNALITPDCPPTPIFDPSTPGYEANCVTSTPVSAWMATKTVSPTTTIASGPTATYTVTIKNTGAVDLTGSNAPAVEDDLSDVLDDATYNNDVVATVGTPAYNSPNISWTGDLTAGQTGTVTYSATVKPESQLGSKRLANAVTGSSNCPATAITDPSDSNYNPNCAVISLVATTDSPNPDVPTTPGTTSGTKENGLANTGHNILFYSVSALLLIAMGLVVLRRKALTSNTPK